MRVTMVADGGRSSVDSFLNNAGSSQGRVLKRACSLMQDEWREVVGVMCIHLARQSIGECGSCKNKILFANIPRSPQSSLEAVMQERVAIIMHSVDLSSLGHRQASVPRSRRGGDGSAEPMLLIFGDSSDARLRWLSATAGSRPAQMLCVCVCVCYFASSLWRLITCNAYNDAECEGHVSLLTCVNLVFALFRWSSEVSGPETDRNGPEEARPPRPRLRRYCTSYSPVGPASPRKASHFTSYLFARLSSLCISFPSPWLALLPASCFSPRRRWRCGASQ